MDCDDSSVDGADSSVDCIDLRTDCINLSVSCVDSSVVDFITSCGFKSDCVESSVSSG